MEVIGCYKNGNYNVVILNDGTKIRSNKLDFFEPEFPENIDLKITNRCDMGCAMCHEESIPNGAHGDVLRANFIDTLHPYTELAIGGGNPLTHPDLIPFLLKLQEKKIFANITVNQKHFLDNLDLLRILRDRNLIYGLGVSLTDANDELIAALKEFPNAVVHVISGLVDVKKLHNLYSNDIKLLILGYKEFGRGKAYAVDADRADMIMNRSIELKRSLKELLGHFSVVSFDNLAIKQLDVRSLLSDEQWQEFYMGDDGNFTMYIDLVKQEFAKNSTSTERWPIVENIKDMFNKIREGNNEASTTGSI